MDGDPGTELDQRLRRLQTALGPVAPATGLLVSPPSRTATRALERARRLRSRHAEKQLRREQRRLEKHEEESQQGMAAGVVQGIAALALGGFALTHPHLWWLFFPAVGFGTTAARIYSRLLAEGPKALPASTEAGALAAKTEASSAQALPAGRSTTDGGTEPADARFPAIALRVGRVDDICRKMLAELKSAPALVRELLRKPEETVEAMRSASHELARRERELRAAITDDDERRLKQEREALNTRIGSETDEVVRGRLGAALESLDGQLAHRTELGTLASRIEAEGTRILYSLENLRAKVLRASVADSASPDLAGDGLREGLEQLSREMDAVAHALEEVHGTEAVRRPLPIPQGVRG